MLIAALAMMLDIGPAAADERVSACIASVTRDRLDCILAPFSACEMTTRGSQADLNACSALAMAAWERRLRVEEARAARALEPRKARTLARLQANWRRFFEEDCALRAPPSSASIRPFANAMCRTEHLAVRAVQVAWIATEAEQSRHR